jgi:hypothetical protein
MKNYQTEFLSQYISNLRISRSLSRLAYRAGNDLYLNNQCVLQSREGEHFAYTVEDNYQDFQTDIYFDDNSPSSRRPDAQFRFYRQPDRHHQERNLQDSERKQGN